MNISPLNLHTWFSERQLKYKPLHFVSSDISITTESTLWIYENLRGRFCLTSRFSDEYENYTAVLYPSFEDPKELIFYELTWG